MIAYINSCIINCNFLGISNGKNHVKFGVSSSLANGNISYGDDGYSIVIADSSNGNTLLNSCSADWVSKNHSEGFGRFKIIVPIYANSNSLLESRITKANAGKNRNE